MREAEAMDLITKPLETCQFKCTYCSSPNIAPDGDKGKILDLEYIFRFLKRFPDTRTIIVNGGEPLLIKPKYYQAILDHKDEHGYSFTLSFTSNLEVFFKNPEPWITMFKRDDVGVCTSFEFGGLRKKGDGTEYDIQDFWEVSNHFKDTIGYRPDFISVITDSNYEVAITNVLLAREMDVECKLNYAMGSGHQTDPFVLAKIYSKYIEIFEAGLLKYEFNSKQMTRRLGLPESTSCPQNRLCDHSIRALNPDGDYYSCGSFADDKNYGINFEEEMIATDRATPLQDAPELIALKQECLTCPLFDICNGCRKTIHDMKRKDLVEVHCNQMKPLASKIISINESYKMGKA